MGNEQSKLLEKKVQPPTIAAGVDTPAVNLDAPLHEVDDKSAAGLDVLFDALTHKITTTESGVKKQESLERMLDIRQRIEDVKKNLYQIIEAVIKDASTLDRLSHAWGELPAWQKISAGAVFPISAIIAGIITSTVAPVVVGSIAGLAIGGTGTALTEHHQLAFAKILQLKQGITGIVDILGVVVLELDGIRLDLAQQITAFREENNKLSTSIHSLNDQLYLLTTNIDAMVVTHGHLNNSRQHLEEELKRLKAASDKKEDVLQKTTQELQEVTREYKKLQEMMNEEVNKLRELKSKMALDVVKAETISSFLDKTAIKLSDAAEAKQKEYSLQRQLDRVISTKEEHEKKSDLLTKLSTTEHEFAEAADDLHDRRATFNGLLFRHQELLARFSMLEQQMKAKGVMNPRAEIGSSRCSIFHENSFTEGGVGSPEVLVGAP